MTVAATTILMNDVSSFVVLRDLLLLFILTSYEKNLKAIEIALHLWYSAFLRPPNGAFIGCAIRHLLHHLSDLGFSVKLGQHSTLTGSLMETMHDKLTSLMMTDLNPQEVAKTYQYARSVLICLFQLSLRLNFLLVAGSVHPEWTIVIANLLSHCLATLNYCQCGIVFPFGAAKDYFTQPNLFLFSPVNHWLQDDFADPLGSWKCMKWLYLVFNLQLLIL
jgi:hypothetical protein